MNVVHNVKLVPVLLVIVTNVLVTEFLLMSVHVQLNI